MKLAMQKKRVLIYVASTPRDGKGACYMKWLLEKRGYAVKLCHIRAMPHLALLKYKPHIVIMHQATEQPFSRLAYIAKSMGSFVVVIRSEGTAGKDWSSFIHWTKYTKKPDDVEDLEIVWGKTFRDLCIEKTDISPEKVKICGVPRFDIYFRPLNKILSNRQTFCQKYGLDPKKKIIAYTPTFAYADVDLKKASTTDLFVESMEWIVNAKKIALEHRQKVVSSFLEIAKQLPEANFIIKIHPMANMEYYVREVRKSSLVNVRVIAAEDIENVVANTDILIHSGSTSSTEAWIFNKPTITASFTKDAQKALGELSNGGDIAKNHAALKKYIKYYLNGGKIKARFIDARKRYVRKWYDVLDGNSTNKACQEIDALVKNKNADISRKIPSVAFPGAINNDLRDLIRHAIYAFLPIRRIYLTFWLGIPKEEVAFIEKNDMRAIFPQRKLQNVCKKIYSVLAK